MPRWSRRAFVAAAAAGLAACAGARRPALRELYSPTQGSIDPPPLIVIPGAFGSSLRRRGDRREIWPRGGQSLLFSEYREFEIPIDPATLEPLDDGVEAHEIIAGALWRDFYGHVLQTLEKAGGYTRCTPRTRPGAGRRHYYVYVYDFRRDNVAAARGLHALIEQIRADHGDARLEVDVLAHSNGALVARYYSRYGTAELPDEGAFAPTGAGAAALRRLLLVGAPNLGTLQPVLSHLRGEEIGFNRIAPEVMATCPATMQIMPHPALPWLIGADGAPLAFDLYDVGMWADRQWSVFDPGVAARVVETHGGGQPGRRYLQVLQDSMARHLRRGRRFAESLAVAGAPHEPAPYVFGGDCAPTLGRLVAERVRGRWHARERVRDIVERVPGVDYDALMFEPGDTVVTRSSLLGRARLDVARPRAGVESMRIAQSVFLCEQHRSLTGNPSFQDNLLNTLLSVDPA